MTITTVVLLIFAAIIAGVISFYHYLFKAKNKSNLLLFLAFLRFCSFFTLFVLIINPLVVKKEYLIKKNPLVVLVDNSKSITNLNATKQVQKILNTITENEALNKKYNVQLFRFDTTVSLLDSLTFTGKQTLISSAQNEIKQLYTNESYPTLLLSDGNQTQGINYATCFGKNTQVYPVVLGDTTKIFDSKIKRIHNNTYTLLQNKFPIEVFVAYNGKNNTPATVQITESNRIIAKKDIVFSSEQKAIQVPFLLTADKVGSKKITASVVTKIKEKNTINNHQSTRIEVLDKRSKIAIISKIIHPDISALKRSIESSKFRKVTIISPEKAKYLDDYDALILYQPTTAFTTIFENIKKTKKNIFVITGTVTDFTFLQQYINDFTFTITQQTEEYIADYQPTFSTFLTTDIGFTYFSPLENKFGTITKNTAIQTLLNAKIGSVTTHPLFSFSEENKQRKAFLFGENIWKWRLENYQNKNNFTNFDTFIDKTIQYLSTGTKGKKLLVTAKNYYNQGEDIIISAQYFNQNYEFDHTAQLTIKVKNTNTQTEKNYNFIKTNTAFNVNFSSLEPGNYSYVITEKTSKTSTSGVFEIVSFDIEKQFVNPDVKNLTQTALHTKGELFYPSEIEKLVQKLIDNKNYLPIEKENKIKTPLIGWQWLLLLVILLLSVEWFIRKYNGLDL